MNNNNKNDNISNNVKCSNTNKFDEVKLTTLQSTAHIDLDNENVNNSIYITIEDDNEGIALSDNHNNNGGGSMTTNSNNLIFNNRNREENQHSITTLSNEQQNNNFNYPRLYRLLPTHNIGTSVTYHNNSNSSERNLGHTLRRNLNNVLLLSTSSPTQALRSLLNNSTNFRNNVSRNNNINEDLQNLRPTVTGENNTQQQQRETVIEHTTRLPINIGINNAMTITEQQNSRNPTEIDNTGAIINASITEESLNESNRINQSGNNTTNNNGDSERNNSNTATNNVNNFVNNNNNNNRNVESNIAAFNDIINIEIPEYILNAITILVRYLPFIIILIIKFIHDYSLPLFDLYVLQYIMYKMNNSLCKQIGKLSQKSYWILSRDFCIILGTITCRLIIANSKPDFYGVLIPPSLKPFVLKLYTYKNNTVHASSKLIKSDGLFIQHNHAMSATAGTEIGNSIDLLRIVHDNVTIKKSITLYTLLYYIAVNDLILKLLTQLAKVLITMIPKKMLSYKTRARLFASVEYTSQFYRAVVPTSQWLDYLNGNYDRTGSYEVIAALVLSSCYIGAKLFELFGRSKPLRKSLKCFFFLTNDNRKPTNEEINAAGAICPICHDSYNSPIILQCGHIFCDDCVGTWFKREQTCPMCRTKVTDDPTYQDGSTTFFYQLF